MGHKAVPLNLRNAQNLHHRQITTLRNEKPNSPQFIYIHLCNLTSIFPLWPVMGKRATRMQDCLPKGYVTKCMRCTRRILAIITGDLPHVQYKSAVCTFTFPRCNNKCSSSYAFDHRSQLLLLVPLIDGNLCMFSRVSDKRHSISRHIPHTILYAHTLRDTIQHCKRQI